MCAAALYGLLIIEGWREGGFWSADAFAVAVASLIMLVVALALDRPDPRGLILVGSLLALTAWWLIRAIASGVSEQFLPLGASMLGFAAAYAATRTLAGTARQLAGLGFALLGGLCALAGLAGLVWRWYPVAIPSQGLWRVSSTLTYADAAGLVLAMCLLVALGLDVAPVLVRIAVCLSAAGLLATQSRGAYVAFLGACLVVPWRRYVRFAVPLVAGSVLGAGRDRLIARPRWSPVARPPPLAGSGCLSGAAGRASEHFRPGRRLGSPSPWVFSLLSLSRSLRCITRSG